MHTQQKAALTSSTKRCVLIRPARWLLAAALGLPAAAWAQIYAGEAPGGSTVLSDRPTDVATLVWVAAPQAPAPPAVALAPGAPLVPSLGTVTARSAPRIPRELQPAIREAARAFGLSAALVAAIAAAESAFDPSALSPKGAAGLMQLMPATARRFKVGNRYSPVQSLNGGAAYLRWLSDRYDNDLTRVVAAYNAGEQAVSLANGVPPYPETQVYVQRVLHYLKHFSQVMSTGG
jgi:soluble lytic murein transglycosylase-like protein